MTVINQSISVSLRVIWLALLVIYFLNFSPEFSWFGFSIPYANPFVTFLVFMLSSYVIIYIHELGHALAGILVGFSIHSIHMGRGKKVFSCSWGKTRFVVNDNLGGGYTFLGRIPSRNWIKSRYFLFILGGVSSQALLCLLIITLSPDSYQEFLLPEIITMGKIFVHLNLAIIVFNLVPLFDLGPEGTPIKNDGLQLLSCPFLKEREIQNILSSGITLDAQDLFIEEKFQEAGILFQECIEQSPQILLPKINQAAVLLKQGKWEEAERYLQQLKEAKVEDPLAFYLDLLLAWITFAEFTEESLEKTTKLLASATELASKFSPKVQAIQDLQGCLLIEKGDLEGGMALLKKQVNLKKTPLYFHNEPILFIFFTYGMYQQNNEKELLPLLKKIKDFSEKIHLDDQVFLEKILEKTNRFDGKYDS